MEKTATAWADAVAADEELLKSHPGREILLHRYALAWFAPATDEQTAPTGPVFFQGPREDEAPEGWRADLSIRAALVGAESPYPGAPPSVRLPSGRRVIRGGAYRWPFVDARCAARDGAREDGYRSETVGFRVVVEVPDTIPPLR